MRYRSSLCLLDINAQARHCLHLLLQEETKLVSASQCRASSKTGGRSACSQISITLPLCFRRLSIWQLAFCRARTQETQWSSLHEQESYFQPVQCCWYSHKVLVQSIQAGHRSPLYAYIHCWVFACRLGILQLAVCSEQRTGSPGGPPKRSAGTLCTALSKMRPQDSATALAQLMHRCAPGPHAGRRAGRAAMPAAAAECLQRLGIIHCCHAFSCRPSLPICIPTHSTGEHRMSADPSR